MKPEYLIEQQNEINAHHIYRKIAGRIKDAHNKDILLKISKDELNHYHRLKAQTQRELKPNWLLINFYAVISFFLGFTFSVKLMEKAEDAQQAKYQELYDDDPLLKAIIEDEERHEKTLIDMLDEERLNYVGSIVLGLNDALVELTGALAGYTFAFQNAKIIALTGLITGISASFSMAASEFLSTRQEGESEHALKSAIYTGIAYVFTVILLITPYLLIGNPYISLATMLVVAVLIIFGFNYYISVAKDLPFKRRFFEMAGISLTVSLISFLIGVVVKVVFGFEL
ncbi:VIT1/CCC1 transporter family protein [Fusibacter paucivorans]|uniref:VIT1/CCC1 transporter family protein n=1 Tax=Fusibacter paucivorans TaxID=76009 RepID=A0ABS5PSQ5_9FIRM|nr:VIT1/CCC1 transporter family protein [Fusibacter paucivorans]MBS7527581.1 VIT1/CCC1 transporter family protein [Fusibacter paucivorans]